jgi:hypothetical protein
MRLDRAITTVVVSVIMVLAFWIGWISSIWWFSDNEKNACLFEIEQQDVVAVYQLSPYASITRDITGRTYYRSVDMRTGKWKTIKILDGYSLTVRARAVNQECEKDIIEVEHE